MVDSSSAVNGLSIKEMPLYNNNEAGVAFCSYIKATTALGNSFILFDKGVDDFGKSTEATNESVVSMGGNPGIPTEKHTKMTMRRQGNIILPFIRATTVGQNEIIMTDHINTIELNNAGGGHIKFSDGFDPQNQVQIDIMDIFSPGVINITGLQGVNIKGATINLN
jgi:hypothetical protein